MKWGAITAGAAVLALAAGALLFALMTRAGGPGTPAIAPSNTPAVFTTVVSPTVTATPRLNVKPAPAPAKPPPSVTQPSCPSEGDPTGSDTPSCSSGDNQAGDNQAGDSNSGDSSGDDQAGDGKAGGA